MRGLAPAAAALLLTACGSNSHTTAPTVTSTETVTVQPTAAGTATYIPSPQAGLKTVIDTGGSFKSVIDADGTYLVGADFGPAKYRTTGGAQCYWARLNSVDPSDIIESGHSPYPEVVEIRPGDAAFLTERCGTWQML